MYFDAKAITQLISDEAAAAKAAPAVAALRKRFTSPLAVVEAVLVLGGQDRAATEAQVQAFLDTAGIEMRDIPPASKLIEAAAKAEAGDTLSVLNAACAEYYEVETFVLADALAAAEAAAQAAAVAATPAAAPAADKAVISTPTPPPASNGADS
ncbi:type II toxin-antitoxin system VapC family toxin [Paracoccus sp. (in: a-proteobacteria)]|uniref:type II toxin-antitoxin system VapC family toxin n=1 Tax=Paracoccus sp. TaxID=267 RepID=UPI0035B45411